MREIPLTHGKIALVDDIDYDYLGQYNWCYARGYAMRTHIGKNIYMARLIAKPPEGMEVDHINRDSLDNRRENLRICTRSQNCANKRKFSTNTSGVKGVSWDKYFNKWAAHIGYNNKLVHLGRYANLDDAAEAYANGAKKYFGEFAYIDKE